MNTAGSTEVTLESGVYLIVTAKAATDANNNDGLYIVRSHNIKSSIRAVQSADAVSLSIDGGTLSITTTVTYITVSILRLL